MRDRHPVADPLPGVVAADSDGPAEGRSADAALFANAVESTPALIFVADPLDRIVNFNHTCESLTGWRREEVVGRPLLETLVAPDARWAMELQLAIDRGGTPAHPGTAMPIPLATGTGDRRWIEWAFSATATALPCGTARGVLGIGIDVTERLTGERQARRRYAGLARLTHRDMFAALAATLSHELSQPLSAALAYTQGSLRILAQEGAASTEIAGYLEKAAAQARRAGEVARSMRRNMQRAAAPARTLVDVNSAVRAVLELIAADLLCWTITVHLDLAGGLPRVCAEPLALEQVLFTLFQISLEAIGEGSTDRRYIRISTRFAGESTIGIGYTDASPDFVTTFASRLSGSSVGGGDIVALGLSICRSLLRNHDGDLDLQESATGVTFLVTLPDASQGTCR